MMKTIAIISEYNPFHLGHLHQINKIKERFKVEDIRIISLMSGNFIQRGEPSIIDKFKRSEASILCGINLSLEIPLKVTLSSAEGFSYGSVKILNSLNTVDYLCFGCEDPNEKYLDIISDAFIDMEKGGLDKYLSLGVSYPKAKELYIDEKFNNKEISRIIKSPNNILAIEYIKALKLTKSKIEIFPIQRMGGGYNDSSLDKSFSSATSIRGIINSNNNIEILKDHLPIHTFNIIKNSYTSNETTNKEMMFPYIKYKLITRAPLHKISGVNEGLDNKFYSEINNSNSLEELILRVKSKRYTYTRLSRIMCKYFIGFENFKEEETNHVRILGFDDKGMGILNKIKKTCSINLISKFDKKFSALSPLDIQGTRAYSIINKSVSQDDDFKKSPIIKK